jgi:aspartate/methionine/tyrosine aminotransferase
VRIETFRMERMQSTYDHDVEYNLSESGVEPMTVGELIEGAPEAHSVLEWRLGYPEAMGSVSLREHIAGWYPGADVGNVTVMNGGAEVNFITLWTLLEPTSRLAFMVPNYMQGWGLGRHFGAGSDAFHLKLTERDGRTRWALDIDELEHAVTRDTRVVWVTNPNNPTGAVLTEEEMDAVVRVARRHRAWLVADEVYRGAELSGRTTPTFWGRYDRVIVTSGLSKAFALPGLRIGWAVAPPSVIERTWVHHDYTTLTPGMLSERLATVATEPRRREAIFERTRGILRRNLPRVEEWIREHDDILTYVPPEAGAIAYVKYDVPVSSGRLIDSIRQDHSVLIVPGAQFGMGRYFRIGYGSDPEYTMKGLARVSETLRRFG